MAGAANGFLQAPGGCLAEVGMGMEMRMEERFSYGSLEAQRSMEMERDVACLPHEEMNYPLMNSRGNFDQYLGTNEQNLNVEEIFGDMGSHGQLQESLKMGNEWDLESFMQDIPSFPHFL